MGAALAKEKSKSGVAKVAGARLKLSVVVPAYNEEGAVRSGVEHVLKVLAENNIDGEVVVVDDGSTDNTLAEAQASGARVIHYPDNVGYGHALKTGIASSDSEYVAIIDADGTYPAEALPRMLELAAGSDMVVGNRGSAMMNVPFVRRPAKWMLNSLANFLAGRKIDDLNSGLRVFKRPSLERFVPLLPDGFSFTTTITLCMLAAQMKVLYEPIVYGTRVGHSKIRAKHFFNFVLLVVRITVFFQPLRVFLPLGAILFGLGVMKAIYDLFLLNLSQSAMFAMLAAIMIWSLGLLADMISRLPLRR